jgi:hypothetical protein
MTGPNLRPNGTRGRREEIEPRRCRAADTEDSGMIAAPLTNCPRCGMPVAPGTASCPRCGVAFPPVAPVIPWGPVASQPPVAPWPGALPPDPWARGSWSAGPVPGAWPAGPVPGPAPMPLLRAMHGAGATAVIAGLGLIAATFMPLVTYDSGTPDNYAMFSTGEGFGPGNWFALEPLACAIVAIAFGLMLYMGAARPSVAGGILFGAGLAEALCFGLYLPATSSGLLEDGTIGAAPLFGLLAGVAILSAGLVAISARPGGVPISDL